MKEKVILSLSALSLSLSLLKEIQNVIWTLISPRCERYIVRITRFEDYKILLRENTSPAFNVMEIYPLNSLGYSVTSVM